MDIIGEIVNFINSFVLTDSQEINEEQDLVASEIIDSLAILQLIEFISENFGVEIEPDAITPKNFSNVKTIAKLVKSSL